MDTTTHLEWLKSKVLTMPNIAKDAEQQKFSFIAGGNADGTASLEDSLTVPHKSKHSLSYNLAIVLLGNYPNEVKTYFTQNPTHKCLL